MNGPIEQALRWLESRRAQVESLVVNAEATIKTITQQQQQQWVFSTGTFGRGQRIITPCGDGPATLTCACGIFYPPLTNNQVALGGTTLTYDENSGLYLGAFFIPDTPGSQRVYSGCLGTPGGEACVVVQIAPGSFQVALLASVCPSAAQLLESTEPADLSSSSPFGATTLGAQTSSEAVSCSPLQINFGGLLVNALLEVVADLYVVVTGP